jgi:DNA polymerase III alpha subunit (gram-positive type)
MYLKKFDRITFIDIETTGIDPVKNAIIEFAAISTTNNLKQTICQTSFTICPDDIENVEFHPEAMKINKISMEEIKSSIKPIEAKVQIMPFFSEKSLIIGHNFTFDLLFLNKFLGTEFSGSMIKPRIIDTASLLLPLVIMGKLQKNSLYEACKYFNISTIGEHRALNDVNTTIKIFKKLIDFYKK